MMARLQSQLVCKYCWHWIVRGQGLVLLSSLRSLSHSYHFDADLRLLPDQVSDKIVFFIFMNGFEVVLTIIGDVHMSTV